MNGVIFRVVIFFLIFIFFTENLYAQQPFCVGLEKNQKVKKIKLITIKVDNYKSFQVNAIKILVRFTLLCSPFTYIF